MNSKLLKVLLVSILFISMLIPVSLDSADAASVNTQKSRVTYTLKDSAGKKYTVYVIPTSEKKAKASYDSNDGWSSVWAGASSGDTLYKGNYKLYLKKSGAKSVSYTGLQLKDYTYNASQKMIYSIPARYKGQQDLMVVAETESSNFESGDLYYVYKGKLKKAKSEFFYTLRPQNIGKNSFRTTGYNNANGKWYTRDYKLNLSSGKLTETQLLVKRYNDMDKFVKSWRKDWK
ncbi:hypothetical protein [Peribacillus asahii]|uniref:hypothetical protein n=1 Tax=Peribacillus asahii TaxID=228899 RepID=UPI00207924BF|nr:hypothetical protein [Peribacillus asahii]USK71167.1 hypothetical protein LIS76_05230 [Peribacillus asahii]